MGTLSTRLANVTGRRYRWVICALLFLATTVNYMDRQVLGILAPLLEKEIGWSEADYGHIVVAFQTAYALGLLVTGALIDRVGVRLGYAVAVVAWSLAAMAHALAHSVSGFMAARFALGLGEAANFPAAIKAVAEWFPNRERALATGIFNSGSNLGAILAPLIVPFVALTWGWQWAFIILGATGFLWLAVWLPLYFQPAKTSGSQQLTDADLVPALPAGHEAVPWIRLMAVRQAWMFALGKFLTDPIWWFYLYWTAKFLDQNHGISLSKVSLPLITIYLVADIGSIGGGWLSGFLIKRGWSVNAGRKTAMAICAVCVVPVAFATQTPHLWIAVALVSLAACAHQGWSANLFTLVSDTFPKHAVGSVVGFGGMAGAVGGILFSATVGTILQRTGGNYLPIFVVCGCSYLVALFLIHCLAPKLDPVEFRGREQAENGRVQG